MSESRPGLPEVRTTSSASTLPQQAVSPLTGAIPPHPLDREWYIHCDGQTYGPYTGHVLRGFAKEGRIWPDTSVVRVGSQDWTEARADQTLAALFAPSEPPGPANGHASSIASNGGAVVQIHQNFEAPSLVGDPDLDLNGPKSPAVAVILSLLILGLGQIYNGEIGKGILFFVSNLLLWVVLLGWIIWIWAAVDAYQKAKRINLRWHALTNKRREQR